MSTRLHEPPREPPGPDDDGAADHLPGSEVPSVALPSTLGGEVDLAQAARERLVVYVYPRTGVPGEPLLDGWDDIPGARGCTPQSCAFRDTQSELARHGAALIGISAQTPPSRPSSPSASTSRIPCSATTSSSSPTRWACRPSRPAASTLYKRLTFVAEQGRIVKVFYPVFPPDRNAGDVLAWLEGCRATEKQ